MHVATSVLRQFVGSWLASVSDGQAELVQTVAHKVGTDNRLMDEGSAAMVAASLLAMMGAPEDVRIIGGFWTRLYFRTRNN